MAKIIQAVKQASKEAKKHLNVSPKLKSLQQKKKQKRSNEEIPVSLTVNFPLLLKVDNHLDIDSLTECFQCAFNYKKMKSFEVGFELEQGSWIYCFYIVKNKPTKKEITTLLKQKNYKIWDDEDDEDDDVYPIEKDIEYDEDEDDLDEY